MKYQMHCFKDVFFQKLFKWIILIFLISGLSLRTRILTQTFMRIRLHLLVQIINLIIIPFFVFGLVILLFKMHVPMNSLVLMGVVIAASTPTTVSSNVVMTKNAKGNEATGNTRSVTNINIVRHTD